MVTHKLFGMLNQMVVREKKFPGRKQVELWGDHLRILKCLPAWSVPCYVVQNDAILVEMKRFRRQSFTLMCRLAFPGDRTCFSKRPGMLKQTKKFP